MRGKASEEDIGKMRDGKGEIDVEDVFPIVFIDLFFILCLFIDVPIFTTSLFLPDCCLHLNLGMLASSKHPLFKKRDSTSW